jgi:hypothetical protein
MGPANSKFSHVRFARPAQPIDATQALNLSAGVSNCKVSCGRSGRSPPAVPHLDVKSSQRPVGRGAWCHFRKPSADTVSSLRGVKRLCVVLGASAATDNCAVEPPLANSKTASTKRPPTEVASNGCRSNLANYGDMPSTIKSLRVAYFSPMA